MSDGIAAVVCLTALGLGFGMGFVILFAQEMKLTTRFWYWRWRNRAVPDTEITTFHQAQAFLEYIGYGLESAGNSQWYVDAPNSGQIEKWSAEKVISEAIEKRAHLLLSRKWCLRKGR